MITNAYYNRESWLFFALLAVLIFFRIDAAPVYILDEAKNAQCAREMWASGNFVVPTFNGELRTDKPALHYWFMGLSYTLFGVGEWQARLFSGLAGWGTVFLTYFFVKRYVHASAAFFTALSLALSTHFLFEFRLAVPDPYLIFFTALGLLLGFAWLAEKRTGFLLGAAASLALATLAKGPVALALPGLCLLLHIVLSRKWWVFRQPGLLLAAALYLVIALPWYWAVHRATNGAFTRGFFLDHNLNRFSSELEGHGGPFFITLLVVLLGLLPFTVLVVPAVRRFWQSRVPSLIGFAGLVAVVYIVFFTISSTKLPNYPMPCYPFVAMVLGFLLSEYARQETRGWPAYAWWILLVVGLALPVGGFLALQAESGLAHLKWYAIGLGVLPLGIALAWRMHQGRFLQQMRWLSMAYGVFNLYFLGVAYPAVYAENPVTRGLQQLGGDSVSFVAYKDYNPALNFNLPAQTMQVRQFSHPDSLAAFCRRLKAAGNSQVYIITRTDKMAELEPLHLAEAGRMRDLFETPTTLYLRP